MDQQPLNFVNPGIRLTVAALNAAGFETCDSGDGETRDFECDRRGPYVVIMSSSDRLVEQADALVKFLESNDVQVVPMGEEGVQIQASYDPCDGSAIIDVSGIHDRLLPDMIVFPGEPAQHEHSA